ncbi:MAG: hypothetical protein EBX52_11560 [Proteobacteria bacterium]|nr:hypothetical protein [Pseudomonadota bacterium]
MNPFTSDSRRDFSCERTLAFLLSSQKDSWVSRCEISSMRRVFSGRSKRTSEELELRSHFLKVFPDLECF